MSEAIAPIHSHNIYLGQTPGSLGLSGKPSNVAFESMVYRAVLAPLVQGAALGGTTESGAVGWMHILLPVLADKLAEHNGPGVGGPGLFQPERYGGL